MIGLRPGTAREVKRRHTRKVAKVDAQITSEGKLEELLEELRRISAEEAKERLRAILETIWEERKKMAKGGKIRNLENLRANFLKKAEEMEADIEKMRDNIAEYKKEIPRYTRKFYYG